MESISELELFEAREALESLLRKCESAVEGGKLSPGRLTLMKRRIAALEIALILINERLAQ